MLVSSLYQNNRHNISFASTPLLGWMNLPGKHEIRADSTETANEEFPCHYLNVLNVMPLPYHMLDTGDSPCRVLFWNNKENPLL